MNKLSLYEILSFMVPGYILISIVELYNQLVFSGNPLFNIKSDVEKSMLYLALSLFVGLAIHIFTFELIKLSEKKKQIFGWYNRIVYQTVQSLSKNNEFLIKIIPFLNKEYRKISKHDEDAVKESKAEYYLFDIAYFYLETNDKITASKNYQSLYFWFRNMFTISLFLIPFSLIVWIISFSDNFTSEERCYALAILTLNSFLIFIISIITRWLRKKFVIKVLYSYYSIRIHEIDKNNK